ncbi:hypothetical protein EDD29_5006 [Actinocorallia herbida]|uniref:Uncharacterized protein n=1 Tax=Actinocorallia herbida TaxID=58109 RepID=A0A3N1D1J9_9ACTN|nr:hypothetical protein [Actinocorallia herbida]ROO87399.1 hypothetical protein EDD29_5006 [Actinocorallia herbida]
MPVQGEHHITAPLDASGRPAGRVSRAVTVTAAGPLTAATARYSRPVAGPPAWMEDSASVTNVEKVA